MTLIRCSDQKKQTLEEFYSDFIPDKNKFWANVGTSMLSAVKLIKDTFKETSIYGLTSHATLMLLSKDSYETPWFVAVSSSGDEFHIEYKMTTDKQPWSNAIVKGSTKNLLELKKLIIIAMSESQGWPNSNELKNLFNNLNSADKNEN